MSGRVSRAGVRRLIALHPECRRMRLFETLAAPELTGAPEAEIGGRMATYLLDPGGRPLQGDPAWLERCLLATPLAPGWATIDDDVAAVLAAGALSFGERLRRRRFAPRADDAIAAATFSLEPADAARAIVQLALQHGPDENQLHLALLQAGLALAWRPDLADREGTNELIDVLVGLLDRKSPRPLLEAVTPILGALGAEIPRVRDAVMKRFVEARRRITERREGGGSFLSEFRALDRERTLPDEDYYLTLPDRHVVETCAKILGRAAETLEPAEFVALQNVVLDGDVGETLLPPLVGGLINAAAIDPLAQLVGHLLATRDAEPRALALDIAAQIPLDALADVIVDALTDDRAALRVKAVGATVLLAPEIAVPALLARLDDPDPDVCAVAARAIADLDQREELEARRMPGEIAIGKTRERTAAVRAALGDASGEVVAPLLALALHEVEREGDTPIVDTLGEVLGSSVEGIALAAEVLSELPDALPIIALALTGDAVPLAPGVREPLARALEPAITAGDDAGLLALGLLARFSLGDAALHARVVALANERDGYAGQFLDALANIGVRSAAAGALLAPIIADREHLAGALTAAGVAGVALPVDHPAWSSVRELLGLGSVASAVAHQALVNRARVRVE